MTNEESEYTSTNGEGSKNPETSGGQAPRPQEEQPEVSKAEEEGAPSEVENDGEKTSEAKAAKALNKLLEEFIKKRGETQKSVLDAITALGSLAGKIEEMGAKGLFSPDVIKTLESYENVLPALGKKLAGEVTVDADGNVTVEGGLLEDLNDSIENFARLVVEDIQIRELYMAQLEDSQYIPETLKNPTLERMALRLNDEQRKKYKIETKLVKGKEVVQKYDGEAWNQSDELYQQKVREWFISWLEKMEDYELSFEEQGDIYRYLPLYVNNFIATPETQNLGEELRDLLERRRIAQRVARVWNLSGPDGIMAEGSRITFSTFASFFKDESLCPEILNKDGSRKKDRNGKEVENPVERELQNYERMGRILRDRRDELRQKNREIRKRIQEERQKRRGRLKDDEIRKLEKQLRKDAGIKNLEREIKAKEQYIIDYYKLGGSVHDEGLNGAYIGSDEYDGSNDNKDGFFYRVGTDRQGYADDDGVWQKDIRASFYKTQIKELREKDPEDPEAVKMDKRVWAKKYAGKLWSITLRAAHHDVQLNGTGDFFAARILNLSDRLATNALMKNSTEHWDPIHRDNPYEIGLEDVITSFTDKIRNKEVLKKIGIMFTLGQDEDGEEITIKTKNKSRRTNLKTLENFKWGSSELWNKVMMDPEVRPPEGGALAIRYTRFNDSDGTRKDSWGADSFFARPTSPGLVGREKDHAERGTSATTYYFVDRNGDPLRGSDGKQLRVDDISGQEWGWIDDIDRSCEGYLRSPQAEEWLGNPVTGYAQTATIREWINTATKNGMIDSKTRSILLLKHLGTTNKWRLDRMVEISVLWNDFKMNRGSMSFQTFLEFLKRAFGYVFTDELR